jgi:hypothetical protein
MAKTLPPTVVTFNASGDPICDPDPTNAQRGDTVVWNSLEGDFVIEFPQDAKQNPFTNINQKFVGGKTVQASGTVRDDAARTVYQPTVTLNGKTSKKGQVKIVP